jgi:hypothetical protein
MGDKNLLIEGSRGQPVINQAAALMTKLASEIPQMKNLFGLAQDAGVPVVASTTSATRSVQELVRRSDDLQIIDVGSDTCS